MAIKKPSPGSEVTALIAMLQEQLTSLQQRAAASGSPPNQETLQEDRATTLEELRVAIEELHQQNEELTRTHKAVEVERQRYQELFDFAPDGYLVTDAYGVSQEANRAAAGLLNVPSQALVGKPLLLFVAQEERRFFSTWLRRRMQEKQPQEWELCLQPRDRAPFNASLTLNTLTLAAKEGGARVVRVRWLLRDITRRTRAEEALQRVHAELEQRVAERTAALTQEIARRKRMTAGRQESEERLRLFMENVTDYAIFFLTPEGRVAQWNAGAERMCGYTEAEILGQDAACIFTEKDRASGAHIQELQQAARTGQAEDERWHVRKGGARFWGSGIMTALRDEGGALRGFAKVLRDLTAQQRAAAEREDLLRQLELERLRMAAVLQHMPAGVVIAEAPSGKLVLGNAQLEALLGHAFRPVAEIAQYGAYTGVHPDGRPYQPAEWPMARALTTGEVVTAEEILLPHQDGSYCVTLTSATPLRDHTGRIVAAVTITHDITARKRTEEELARVNAELRQFTAIVSHDFHEPLRTITSHGQFLADRYGSTLDADGQESLTFMVEGARRLQQMLTDLLAYTQVGGPAAAVTPVACDTLVVEVLDRLQTAIHEHGAIITHDPLPVILGDATRLGQVLQNLLSNALKFRRPEEPPQVHISATREGQLWRFVVQDNGIGIDPKHAERIFQVFQRLHTRDTYPGTGMGLAICKRLIEQQGGQIWVESEPGHGATFFFTLPAFGLDLRTR